MEKSGFDVRVGTSVSPENETRRLRVVDMFSVPTEELFLLCVLPKNIASCFAHAPRFWDSVKAPDRPDCPDPELRFSCMNEARAEAWRIPKAISTCRDRSFCFFVSALLRAATVHAGIGILPHGASTVMIRIYIA